MKLQLTLLFIVKNIKYLQKKIRNIGIQKHGGGGTIQDYFAVMETLSYRLKLSNQV
jgi:hypothetical protein